MMHDLRTNDLALVASNIEEASHFAVTPTLIYSPHRLLQRAPTQQGYGTDPSHTFHDDL